VIVIWRISTSFVFVLVFLTVLGHACELPIGMMVAAHAHEDAHDSSDHHADDSQFECDAVLAVRPGTPASANLDLDVHTGPHPVFKTIALHIDAALPDSPTRHPRPPLFLLHAALLI
jgi:hypothetical protein